MKDIYLSLGSNLGNREENLNNAIQQLQEKGAILRSRSSFYKTEGWGNVHLKEFLNMAILISWDLQPMELLLKVQEIEKDLGRKGETKGQKFYQDRQIDIDILYIDDMIINSEELTVPHPRLRERLFVLEPMNEIAADFQDPRDNRTIKFSVENCSDANKVEKLT